jgi:23S rRNA pseudouridine1911/1915/1917 synthase
LSLLQIYRMRKFVFTITQENIGKSIRTYLRQHQHFSRRMTNRLKENPNSFIYNDIQVQSTYRMLLEGILEINIPQDLKQSATAENIPIAVVFEDEDILVVDKPPYMPVHPSHQHQMDTLANAVAKHAEQMGEGYYTFRAVNRLDRNTSGLVVLAKNAYAASRLSGNIYKKYMSVVWGEIKEAGTVASPIRLKPSSKMERETATYGDHAVTHYKPLAYGNGLTLLELELETGRTHQIRVHMSSIGHPLVGDDLYGGANIEGIDRQALHCSSVELIHPYTKVEIKLQSAIPKDIQTVINCIMEQ